MKMQGQTKTCLVVDYCDSKRSYRNEEIIKGKQEQNRLGNDVMKQLLEYVKEYAREIGADAMYIGKQHHQRMDKFKTFTDLKYESVLGLRIVGPLFGPDDKHAERYTDNVEVAEGSFCEVDLRRKPPLPPTPNAS